MATLTPVTRICRKCGNRLQPQRARIGSGKRLAETLRGVCDICQITAEVSDPESFGLEILDAPGYPSRIIRNRWRP